MTKEEIQYEAQSIIQEWGSNDSAPYVEFVEKLASMELPESFSNLDEAANKFAVSYDQGTCDGIAQDCFKAGAEWMAGQGETFNGFMSISGKRSLIAIEGSSQNFKFGEDVIVQIRKKQ